MGREQELYDQLVAELGFDSANPGWSERLRALHRHSRTRRLQLVPEFFYTSVLNPALVPNAAWEAKFELAAGVFDHARQVASLGRIPPRIEELQAFTAQESTDPTRYYWGNDQFSHADAAIYYSVIRHQRPSTIVEIGCGHSTKLAMQALVANGTGSLRCIEPYPPPWLQSIRGPIEHFTCEVQTLGKEWFSTLQRGDILFIDSSHIAKTGSDVNHLLLNILPTLNPGVIVQVHDICLPYEYPRYWSEDVLCYWNEQYVLAALLTNTQRYEVLFGIYFLARTDPGVLASRIPSITGVFPGGGSLWIVVR